VRRVLWNGIGFHKTRRVPCWPAPRNLSWHLTRWERPELAGKSWIDPRHRPGVAELGVLVRF